MAWNTEVQEDGTWEARKKGASRIGKELWQKYNESVNFVSEARGMDDREKLHALPTQA